MLSLIFLIIVILTGDSLWFWFAFSDDQWAFFHVCVGHLYSCFWNKKMSILALCPFLNCFSSIKLYNSLAYIAYLLYMIWKYSLSFHRLPFLFVDGLFCFAETIFDIIPYYIFAFVVHAFGVISNNSLPKLLRGLSCFLLWVLWLQVLFLNI